MGSRNCKRRSTGWKTNWFMKRKNSRPFLMSLTKPLPKCLVTKNQEENKEGEEEKNFLFPSSSSSIFLNNSCSKNNNNKNKSFKIHNWILHYVNQMCSTFYTRLFV